MAMELRKMSIDYERRRMQLQVYYGTYQLALHLLLSLVSFLRLCFMLSCSYYIAIVTAVCLTIVDVAYCVEQVKNAERVRLEQIPLPEAPSTQAGKLMYH